MLSRVFAASPLASLKINLSLLISLPVSTECSVVNIWFGGITARGPAGKQAIKKPFGYVFNFFDSLRVRWKKGKGLEGGGGDC